MPSPKDHSPEQHKTKPNVLRTSPVSLLLSSTKASLSTPRDSKAMNSWRRRIRLKLRQLLELSRRSASPPATEIIDSKVYDKVIMQRLRITPKTGGGWDALFLVPQNLVKPVPAFLCLHGHMYDGMSAMTGCLTHSTRGAQSLAAFKCDYAIHLARMGYATLSFDFVGYGTRRIPGEDTRGMPDSHLIHMLMLGKPFLGQCVDDAEQSLLALEQMPGIARSKVGVIGFSMGGTLAAMLAAVNSRARAAVVSGGFPSRRAQAASGRTLALLECIPGLLQWMDMDDIMAAVAPRPMFISMEAGNNMKNARALLSRTRRSYRLRDKADALTINYDNEGVHRFIGAPAYDWIQKLWHL